VVNCIKKGSVSEGNREKKAYEPPKAMRLDDVRNGADACDNGSGDASFCYQNGNSAGGTCYTDIQGPEMRP